VLDPGLVLLQESRPLVRLRAEIANPQTQTMEIPE
jgi:hypothetical protein